MHLSKKYILILCCYLSFGIFSLGFTQPLNLAVNAESALLINADTGAILFEKSPNMLCYPASITKVATGLYALSLAEDKMGTVIIAEQDAIVSTTEEARRRSNYTQPAYWLVPGCSHIGIKKGEALSLKDLLYGLMVASGNDAANVIAQHLGGTVPNFMASLNSYLKTIGCKNTTFYNPHGLFDPKHQTTATDMAIMMREALKNATFCEIIASRQYKRPKTNKQESTVLVQTNRMIRKGKYYYEKTIGGKTGYLSLAGHTLVVAAKDGDRTLIAVLLKSKDRSEMFLDAKKMFEAAFNQPKVQRTLLKSGQQDFTLNLRGASAPISTYLSQDVIVDYYPAEEPKLKCLLYWTAKELPVKKDQVVGELHIHNEGGQIIQTVPLLSTDDVSSTWWGRMFG